MHISNSRTHVWFQCTRWKYWRFPSDWSTDAWSTEGRLWCVLFGSCRPCVWGHVSIAALIELWWNGLFCTVLTSSRTLHRYKTRRMLFKILRSVSAGFCNIKWDWATKCLQILNRQDECFASINVRFSAFHTSIRDTYFSRLIKVAFTAFKHNTWVTCVR
jgi:hypothetical protein